MKQTKYYVCAITTMYDGVEFSEKILIETDKVDFPNREELLEVYTDVKIMDTQDGWYQGEDTAYSYSVDEIRPTEDGLILKDYLTTIVL